MLTLEDGYGYLDIEIRSAAEEPTPVAAVRLDTYQAWNTYVTLRATHEADHLALAAAWGEWLATRGLPELSHATAFKVADALAAEVTRLAGEGEKGTEPPATAG